MARRPNDDRSDSHDPKSDSTKASRENRANQLNPGNDEHGGPKAQQRQDTPDRDFAPGEDGECH